MKLLPFLNRPVLPQSGGTQVAYNVDGVLLSPTIIYDAFSPFFVFFLLLQCAFPWAFRKGSRFTLGRWKNWVNNFFLGIIGYLVVIAGNLLLYGLFESFQIPAFNLFERLSWSPLTRLLVGLFALDFTTFFLHYAFHKVPLLWTVHRVHHIEYYVDVFTLAKFHPIEAGAYSIIIYLATFFSGCTWMELIIFLNISKFFSIFLHSDWRLPYAIEKYVGIFFMTSGHHLAHHDEAEAYHQSNFGLIITFWDRIFGTHRPPERGARYKYGLKEYDGRKTGFWRILAMLPLKTRVSQNEAPKT